MKTIVELCHEIRRQARENSENKIYPSISATECLEDTLLLVFKAFKTAPSEYFLEGIRECQIKK